MIDGSHAGVDVTAGEEPLSYTLGWTISLSDSGALWEAAANQLSNLSAATSLHIVDTLGPREDPCISDCLISSIASLSIPGCELLSVCCNNLLS